LSYKNFDQGIGRGRPCKIFLLIYSLITVQDLVAVCHTMWAYVGPTGLSKFGGTEVPPPCDMGRKHASSLLVLPCRLWSL